MKRSSVGSAKRRLTCDAGLTINVAMVGWETEFRIARKAVDGLRFHCFGNPTSWREMSD
jgi:hypothetical protein